MTTTTAQQAGEQPSNPVPLNFTPFYLLSNCRLMTGRKFEREPNWVIAMNLFAVGSTTATKICRDAGIDPDGIEVRPVAARASAGSSRGNQS